MEVGKGGTRRSRRSGDGDGVPIRTILLLSLLVAMLAANGIFGDNGMPGPASPATIASQAVAWNADEFLVTLRAGASIDAVRHYTAQVQAVELGFDEDKQVLRLRAAQGYSVREMVERYAQLPEVIAVRPADSSRSTAVGGAQGGGGPKPAR